MPIVGVGEGLATLFSNFIQGAGRQRLKSYLENQRNQAGVDQNEMGMAMAKINDPNTPFLEKVQWQDRYKKLSGRYLPMNMEEAAPVPGLSQPPAGPEGVSTFLENATPAEQQDFLKKSAERQKILQSVEASKALTEERKTKQELTRKQIGEVGKAKPTATSKPKDQRLAILKEQFDSLMKRRKDETIDYQDKITDEKKYKEYTDQLDEIQTQYTELLKEQNPNIKIPIVGWGTKK